MIKNKQTYLYTTAVFAVVMAAIYLLFDFFPFGEKTLLTSDMRSQYADFLSYFKNMPLSTYSFKLGIGNDLLSFAAYYLMSPVNLLVYLFKDISVAASVIFTVKLLLAALSCNFWLRHCEIISRSSALEYLMPLLSVAYAFCGFTTMYSMDIIWFDTVYLFPLLILSIEKALLKGGRLMPLCVAAVIITNFYTGIMALYFSLLFCVVLYLLYKEKADFFKMVYNYFIGVSMAALILMPTLIRLSTNKMSADNFAYKFAALLGMDLSKIFEIILFVWIIALIVLMAAKIAARYVKKCDLFIKHKDKINNALFTILGAAILLVNLAFVILSFRKEAIFDLKYFLPFTYNKDAPQLYSGIVVYIGILAGIFTAKKAGAKKYVLLLSLVALSLFPLFSTKLDTLLHLGQVPISFPFRYTFIITFFMIIAAAYGISCFDTGNLAAAKKYVANATTVILGCVFIFEIFANALGTFKYNEISWYGYTTHDSLALFTEKTGDAVKHIEDNGFYRVEKDFNRNINDSMQFNYNGVNHYSSMYNHELINLLDKLGCICTMHYGTYIGHTPLMDLLFSVKYTLASSNTEFLRNTTISEHNNYSYYDDCYEKIYSNDCVSLYKNPVGSNLAFHVNEKAMSAEAAPAEGISFAHLNEICNSIVGYDLYPYKLQDVSEIDTNVFSVTATESGKMFLKTAPTVQYNMLYVNGVPAGSGFYGTFGYVNPNMYCAYVKAGETVTVSLDSANALSPFDIGVYVEADDAYNAIAEFLAKNKVDYTFKSEDEIILNVSSDGSAIFTSIPFDNNWKVISDENVTPKRVFNTFLGLECPSGTYEIKLKYIPSGLYHSLTISLLAVLIFISDIFIKKRLKR